MGATIGVLGSKKAVDTMMTLVEDYPQYSFLDLSYNDETESEGIFRRNKERMDVCLFTGPWPYTKVLSALGTSGAGIPMVYANHTGGLYQTIARMLINGADLSRVSIDVISEDDAKTAFSEIGYQPEKLFLMPFVGAVPRESFISFHRELWREGRTTSMITLLSTAYRDLKQERLPVYHSSVGVVAMREAVARAVLELQSVKLREQQLVVGLVEVTDAPQEALGQALMEYGERVGLGVVPMDGGRYALFLTRGGLKQITNGFRSFHLPEKLSEMFLTTVHCGLGVGPTVNTCYSKALMALNYARKEDESCAYVIFDDGQVNGPLVGNSAGLAYNRRSIDRRVLANVDDSGLGVATLSKVKAALADTGSVLTTPEQLADSLRISKRNARRILVKLSDAGLATIIGIDQPGTRGRPQRVFQVHLI